MTEKKKKTLTQSGLSVVFAVAHVSLFRGQRGFTQLTAEQKVEIQVKSPEKKAGK